MSGSTYSAFLNAAIILFSNSRTHTSVYFSCAGYKIVSIVLFVFTLLKFEAYGI